MKKLFAIIMSVLMIACFMPTAAFAANNTVSSSESLMTALSNASSGDTITLGEDITLSAALTIGSGKDITLNLGGKTLTNAGGCHTIVVEKGAKLTVQGTGTVDNVSNGVAALYNKGGTVILNGGTFTRSQESDSSTKTDGKGNSWYTIKNIGTMTINSEVAVENKGHFSSMITNGYWDGATKDNENNGNDNPVLTINGGNFNGGVNTVKNDDKGTLYINDGKFENTTQACVQNHNSATISGGTFSPNGVDAVVNCGKTSCTVTENITLHELTITGGTFNGNVSRTHGSVTVNGGTFSEPSVLDYLGENANVTIKLTNAHSEGLNIPAGRTVTLDLNGQNIATTTGCAIKNKGNLTVEGTGNVSTTASSSAAIANFPGAVANVHGGTYAASPWYVIKNMGEMTIDGSVTVQKPDGSSDSSSLIANGWAESTDSVADEDVYAQADKAKLIIKSGEFRGKAGENSCSVVKNDDYGVLEISGGAFDSTNNTGESNATTILNWHKATISGGTFEGQYPLSNGAYNNGKADGEITISGGIFKGKDRIFGMGQGGNGKGSVAVTGGSFTAPAIGGSYADKTGGYTLSISGGTFSTDPKEYLASSRYYTTKNAEGAYTVHYASSGSGGSTTNTTTDTVTNTTEDKTTDAGSTTGTNKVATTTATVKTETKTATDGTKTVAATVDTTTATKIVEKAVENKSEEVVIDTSTTSSTGTTAVTETAAGTTTKVDLPEQTVKAIAEKTEAAVTIKSDAAEIKLDTEAVKAVAEQAGDTGTVNLVVETVAQNETKVEVDLKLVTSKGTVSDFKGGSVSVTVKLNTALAAKPVVCVYIDDNGTYHKVKGVKNANGTYTFETGHFSTYAVMTKEEADKVIAEQTENVEKLIGDLKLKARSAKTKAGNIKVTLTADEDSIKAIEDLGYTVKYKFYRSTKKASSYKAKLEGTGKTYTNTTGKKGTKYYYKARVTVYDAQGELIAKTALNRCKYAARTK